MILDDLAGCVAYILSLPLTPINIMENLHYVVADRQCYAIKQSRQRMLCSWWVGLVMV